MIKRLIKRSQGEMFSIFEKTVVGLVRRIWGSKAEIKLFGSCVNGFITKESDLDCGIIFTPDLEKQFEREAFWIDWREELKRSHEAVGSNNYPTEKRPEEKRPQTRAVQVALRKVRTHLDELGFTVESVERARVPILKCELALGTSPQKEECFAQQSGTIESSETDWEKREKRKSIPEDKENLLTGKNEGIEHSNNNVSSSDVALPDVQSAASVSATEKAPGLKKIEIDISAGHVVVFENSRLLHLYSDIHPCVKTLALIIKLWAKRRQINDSLSGTLSSYSYILMLIHYLQNKNILPNLQDASLREKGFSMYPLEKKITLEAPEHAEIEYFDYKSVGYTPENVQRQFELKTNVSVFEELKGFFFYFGYDFDMWTNLVSINGGSKRKVDYLSLDKRDPKSSVNKEQFLDSPKLSHICPREEAWSLMRKRTWLSIEDPFEIFRVLGTNAKGQERLTYELRRAFEICQSQKLWLLIAPAQVKNKRTGEREFKYPINELHNIDPDSQRSDWLGNCHVDYPKKKYHSISKFKGGETSHNFAKGSLRNFDLVGKMTGEAVKTYSKVDLDFFKAAQLVSEVDGELVWAKPQPLAARHETRKGANREMGNYSGIFWISMNETEMNTNFKIKS